MSYQPKLEIIFIAKIKAAHSVHINFIREANISKQASPKHDTK